MDTMEGEVTKKQKPEIRYEDSAEVVIVPGWACKICHRHWGKDEHMARYCCSTSQPCECGKRKEKAWTHCKDCRDKKDRERWEAKPVIDWDGAFPIGEWDSDKYFFNEDDLRDYLDDCSCDIADLRFVTCEPNSGREFVMSEFLQDELCEDQELDEDEINKVVNDWIEKNAPFSWSMTTGQRLCNESVLRLLE